jgi:hypothetical protein
MSNSVNYYARRLYWQSVLSPEVNSLDEDEVAAYVEQEARKLCLEPEPIVEKARTIQPTTAEFQTAAEIRDEDYGVTLK